MWKRRIWLATSVLVALTSMAVVAAWVSRAFATGSRDSESPCFAVSPAGDPEYSERSGYYGHDLSVQRAVDEMVVSRRPVAMGGAVNRVEDLPVLLRRTACCAEVIKAHPVTAVGYVRGLIRSGPATDQPALAVVLATIGGRDAASELAAMFDGKWVLSRGDLALVATAVGDFERLGHNERAILETLGACSDDLVHTVLLSSLRRLRARGVIDSDPLGR